MTKDTPARGGTFGTAPGCNFQADEISMDRRGRPYASAHAARGKSVARIDNFRGSFRTNSAQQPIALWMPTAVPAAAR
ncbi:hypothetical protein ACFZBE_40765 [Streptomyces sp. NPDC008061]|uniref:hypothetical protein n=1 Tax=Streptomyces sp. NPDC008061 TaxID=3364805 RepID=UPI0036EEEF33